MIAKKLRDPAEVGHGFTKHFEYFEPDAAHIIGLLRKQMKAQAPHAEPVPVAQHSRLDARIGDSDAAQALRKTR